jgi:putative ABC transport system permease protein
MSYNKSSISWLSLAWRSLLNRKLSTVLTVFSMMLSLVLLMSVERIKRAAQDGFTQSVSGVDLVVGARSGSLQVILYSVFNIGQATQNVSIESYNEIKNLPEVEWTIPYSLGDGHRGFRVVATNNDFFKYYQYRSKEKIELAEGKKFSGFFDVVIGADVAKTLKYSVGSKVVVAHGTTSGVAIQEHDDKPFTVVGVMKPTGTALDRSLYISLEGMEAIHIDWQTGSAPSEDKQIKAESLTAEMLQPKTITSFFARMKSRFDILKIQRWINEYKEEPLVAVIPGVVLSELWASLSVVDKVLKSISFLVMLIGLFSMLIAIMTSLNERRREMAILRALGAKLSQVSGLILFETMILTSVAVILACATKVVLEISLGPWAQARFGLYLQDPMFSMNEIIYIAIMFVSALLMSLVPAYRAMKSALKDGLSLKV